MALGRAVLGFEGVRGAWLRGRGLQACPGGVVHSGVLWCALVLSEEGVEVR